MNMFKNKKGDEMWTLTRILLVLFLFFVVVGLYIYWSGSLDALFEKMGLLA
jgi:hypothetical protein